MANATISNTVEEQKRSDVREQLTIDDLDNRMLRILRKYRKRMDPSGYQSLPDLWQDLKPVLDATLQLPSYQAIQRLLNLTSSFYEFCHGYRADTEKDEFEEYFAAVDEAWMKIFQEKHDMTDRIRALSVLRDGNEFARDDLRLENALNGALQAALAVPKREE
ncbi:hypothetical protein BX666DRAFT_167575 [Dichotomocladium elegans]|nr:hypothetical protein BX666DRAFT_167575 [Dichotomocladium elegans]